MRLLLSVCVLSVACAGSAHEPALAARGPAASTHVFSADVVIWAPICPDECALTLAHRLDRSSLSAEAGVFGPDNAAQYRFTGDLVLAAPAHARAVWALDAVPSSIKSLPTRELGKAVLYATGGTYLEVHRGSEIWKVILWDRELPPQAAALKTFTERLDRSVVPSSDE